MINEITVEVAGHEDPLLSFSPLVHRCGGITNGVRFANHQAGKFRGGWIVDFGDLERMYLAAKAYRSTLETKVGCEGADGLLRVHAENETCDVCSTVNRSAD